MEEFWPVLDERDVLLFHPYESFDPVIQLVQNAARDPHVLAIKQTLYRTSGESPIVGALAEAAENGKEVTALVELKARFDEARNVVWARRLEDAGCHVIYGIAGYKTHAKALLIVRRDASRIRRYVHLSTGNYNDKTARLYSDIGLMTSNREIAGDVAALFNLLTGYSEAVGWSTLTVEPRRLKERMLNLIDREIQASTPDRPGLIMAKVNSLEDPEICQALYRASNAGVQVMLNIRGICCLRPASRNSRRTSRSAQSSTATWSTPASSTSATAATKRSICRAPIGCAATWSGASRSFSRCWTPACGVADPHSQDVPGRQRQGPAVTGRRHL